MASSLSYPTVMALDQLTRQTFRQAMLSVKVGKDNHIVGIVKWEPGALKDTLCFEGCQK